MIWGELEYTLGGLIVAIAFVVLGLMGLFKWADSGNENDKQKSSEASPANYSKEESKQNPENLETMIRMMIGTTAGKLAACRETYRLSAI